ncbi:hypothetical protein BpOF4_02300 [Alkalihalophilus pseudofirmus OF4]|uniref:Uncharacterized protein n=1 Tax=Alkalihalophilus pseudofirmus (strain ATCC BAA-2126 / JCM 17055 / OF4) TaxID=398511 RepID=D3FVL2_ALKPO|nr:hypothetical protein BpOF4_02300 [Alkalihalophilus pseudofirmus OF4]
MISGENAHTIISFMKAGELCHTLEIQTKKRKIIMQSMLRKINKQWKMPAAASILTQKNQTTYKRAKQRIS